MAGIGSSTLYVSVAAGNTLPNTADVPTQSLGYANLYDQVPVNFTLTQPTMISIGFVATMHNGNFLQWSVNVLQLIRQ